MDRGTGSTLSCLCDEGTARGKADGDRGTNGWMDRKIEWIDYHGIVYEEGMRRR